MSRYQRQSHPRPVHGWRHHYSADLLVEDQIIVELKAVERLCKAHEVQTVNYLMATGLDIGLLINFGAESLEFKKKFRLRHAPNPVNPV